MEASRVRRPVWTEVVDATRRCQTAGLGGALTGKQDPLPSPSPYPGRPETSDLATARMGVVKSGVTPREGAPEAKVPLANSGSRRCDSRPDEALERSREAVAGRAFAALPLAKDAERS